MKTTQSNKTLPRQHNTRSPKDFRKIQTINTRRYNSTETIFLNNNDLCHQTHLIAKSLATVIWLVLKGSESCEDQPAKGIFNEEVYPLENMCTIDIRLIPTQQEVEKTVLYIIEKQELSPECGIMAAAYIDRFLTSSNITLQPQNWRRILLTALLVADKVWEDLAVWNIDYVKSNLFDHITLEDINRLETEFLFCVNYSLVLRPSEYAKYFFELRAVCKGPQDSWRPLNKKSAHILEVKSKGAEEELKNMVLKQRSKSLAYEGVGGGETQTMSIEEFRRVRNEKSIDI
eukprot:TRINITY_DN1258_c0_g1_i2.p1 TRINITY_DN1258_c0_g1~~TRINITY_DN1258_c0_g1_i2.p1  ORF type:complete len:323 (-),score=52.74 TRINITY_DN1258_c0_g1_i2:85-948(-)